MSSPHTPRRLTLVRAPSRSLRAAVAVIGGWTALGLVISAQSALQMRMSGATRPIQEILLRSIVSGWIWAAYTPGVVWVARKLRHLRDREPTASAERNTLRRWLPFLLAHLVIVVVVAVADAVVWAEVRPYLDGVRQPYARVFSGTLLINVTWYAMVVGIAEAVDHAARARERERAAEAAEQTAEALREMLDEARLRALESQLQPHFLFNTLNLVAELVHHEPEAADEMLTHLGALLRRSYVGSAHTIALGEELGFVRAYASILARRYRDRVTFTTSVPAALERHPVPAFLLQPLVENAFRHGVERREGASAVEVTAVARGASLVLQVRDRDLRRGHVQGVREEAVFADELATIAQPPMEGTGIGLANTRERLALLYAGKAGLTLVHGAHATVARAWLPLASEAEMLDLPAPRAAETPAWA